MVKSLVFAGIHEHGGDKPLSAQLVGEQRARRVGRLNCPLTCSGMLATIRRILQIAGIPGVFRLQLECFVGVLV